MDKGTNPYSNLVYISSVSGTPRPAMDIKESEGINGIYLDDYDKEEINLSIRKGAWSSEEDSILINYISIHGEGHWNHLARDSGLKRTGKSCRMRWKNYLHPNVRRGNFTTHEKLRIIDLQSFFGNRWSKIAEFLPGRTDNEIKNYWRTRVQKQAKQLKYDINSKEFKDFTRNIWLPTLLCEQIYASKFSNNIVEDVTTNFEGVATTMPMPEPAQMDDNYWTTLFASATTVDGHLSATDNLSGSACPFPEIDDPTWFSTYGELSDDCFSTYP